MMVTQQTLSACRKQALAKGVSMDDLIEALTIFRKYGNPASPTRCRRGLLWVNVDPVKVSEDDKEDLEHLGFFPESDESSFSSYRFGSD